MPISGVSNRTPTRISGTESSTPVRVGGTESSGPVVAPPPRRPTPGRVTGGEFTTTTPRVSGGEATSSTRPATRPFTVPVTIAPFNPFAAWAAFTTSVFNFWTGGGSSAGGSSSTGTNRRVGGTE